MAVDLPTTAEVRKARHDAAKSAAQRAEAARTPLLAVLGAGELAVSAVSKAVAELPQHLNTDELRKAVAELREQAGHAYAGFAEQGEETWGRIRTQPQVKDALQRIGSYTEKLDSRVDDIVDDARDATEKALTTVSTQTRSTGERIARVTQRFTGRTAETVTSVSEDVSKTVAQAGAGTAEAVTEAGAEVAHETRSTTRRAANRTTPKTGPTSAARKPAARRNGSANDTTPGS